VAAVAAYLTAQRDRLVGRLTKIAKIDKKDLEALLAEVSAEERERLIEELTPFLEDLTLAGAEDGLVGLGVEYKAMLEQVNEPSLDWARARAAEMVGMKRTSDGELIVNPNPRWSIDDTTRDKLRQLVAEAQQTGISNDELADNIEGSVWFSEGRAEMIARTETAFADVEGNLIGWKTSGVVEGKEWSASEDPCPECAALDGQIVPLDDEFDGGDPPRHGNCECDLLPVLSPRDEE